MPLPPLTSESSLFRADEWQPSKHESDISAISRFSQLRSFSPLTAVAFPFRPHSYSSSHSDISSTSPASYYFGSECDFEQGDTCSSFFYSDREMESSTYSASASPGHARSCGFEATSPLREHLCPPIDVEHALERSFFEDDDDDDGYYYDGYYYDEEDEDTLVCSIPPVDGDVVQNSIVGYDLISSGLSLESSERDISGSFSADALINSPRSCSPPLSPCLSPPSPFEEFHPSPDWTLELDVNILLESVDEDGRPQDGEMQVHRSVDWTLGLDFDSFDIPISSIDNNLRKANTAPSTSNLTPRFLPMHSPNTQKYYQPTTTSWRNGHHSAYGGS